MLGSGNTLIQIGALTDWGCGAQNLEWSGEERAGRMLEWVSGKLEYTEEEAASALGISIGELRSLVQTHVISEETAGDMPVTTFRPTDLLLLKMLSQSHASTVRSIERA